MTKYGVYYFGMSQHLEYGEVVLNGFTGYARPPYACFQGKFVNVDYVVARDTCIYIWCGRYIGKSSLVGFSQLARR